MMPLKLQVCLGVSSRYLRRVQHDRLSASLKPSKPTIFGAVSSWQLRLRSLLTACIYLYRTCNFACTPYFEVTDHCFGPRLLEPMRNHSVCLHSIVRRAQIIPSTIYGLYNVYYLITLFHYCFPSIGSAGYGDFAEYFSYWSTWCEILPPNGCRATQNSRNPLRMDCSLLLKQQRRCHHHT